MLTVDHAEFALPRVLKTTTLGAMGVSGRALVRLSFVPREDGDDLNPGADHADEAEPEAGTDADGVTATPGDEPADGDVADMDASPTPPSSDLAVSTMPTEGGQTLGGNGDGRDAARDAREAALRRLSDGTGDNRRRNREAGGGGCAPNRETSRPAEAAAEAVPFDPFKPITTRTGYGKVSEGWVTRRLVMRVLCDFLQLIALVLILLLSHLLAWFQFAMPRPREEAPSEVPPCDRQAVAFAAAEGGGAGTLANRTLASCCWQHCGGALISWWSVA